MSVESEVQKTMGTPVPTESEKVKPKIEDLEVLSINGMSYGLKTISFWDKEKQTFSDPKVVYNVQFRDGYNYVKAPTCESIEDFEALKKHCENMIEIMKNTEVSFEKSAYVNSDVKSAISKINASKKSVKS